jgi:glucose/arabinose dehydrogenase
MTLDGIVIDASPLPAIMPAAGWRLHRMEPFCNRRDALQSQNAQDVSSLAGKILRVNSDGSIPADNPFPDSPVYSFGHRKSTGLGLGS